MAAEPGRAPTHKTFRELPSYYSWGDWDRIHAVKRAIRELELGQLNQAAQVVDAMGCDDRIEGALLQRTKALPSLPVTIEPREDGPVSAKAISKQVTAQWNEMVSDEAAAELLKWGVFLGVGFGQIVWSENWKPKLDVWHPRHFSWRWDTRSFWVTTEGDGMQEVKPGDGRWVVFSPHGLVRSWMTGIIRSLYVPWLLRQWALRDWGRWSESYGGPFKKVKTPASASEDDKQRFVREVAAIGSGLDTTVRVPVSPDPTQQYDVELVEATSTGWEGFERLIDKCESAMSIRILGQNLSTEVKGGSYSATQVHDGIKGDVLEGDSQALGRCLHEQLLEPWAEYVHGDRKLAPLVSWVTKPPEDKTETGNSMKAVGEGLSALRAAGAKPDTDTILERMGVPVTAPAEEPELKPEPGEGKPREKESDGDEALSMLAGMIKSAGGHTGKCILEAALKIRPTGADRGQAYVDALADKAREHGARALKPDVVRVLTAVLSANSYDDLRARLVELYGELEPDAMATVLQRAMVMSEMAGRLSVLEDL